MGENLVEKIKFDSIPEEKLKSLSKVNHNNLIKIAIENSDAVIKGSENIECLNITSSLKSFKSFISLSIKRILL